MKTLAAIALVLAFTSVACGGEASDDAAITLENWKTQPAITAIDAEVSLLRAPPNAALWERKEVCNASKPNKYYQTREKVTDASGMIRAVTVSEGSPAYSRSSNHYYDAQGRLRLIRFTMNVTPEGSGSSEGEADETLVYFDERGAAFWSVMRRAPFDGISGENLLAAPYTNLDHPFPAETRTPNVIWEAPTEC